MAFIGVKVPADAAAVLSKIKVPGEHVPPDEMHVTLVYLGKNVPIPEVLQATLACYTMTKRWAPFRCQTRRVTCFPKNPDSGVPVIARVLCPELHRLHEALRNSLDLLEIDFSNSHPDFKPHITLSYAEEELDSDVKIETIAWPVTELVIWGGDQGVDRIAVTLPLEGKPGAVNPMRQSRTKLRPAV